MKLIAEEKVLTQALSQQAFLTQLVALIEKYHHPKLHSIGVAMPGIVNREKGVVVKTPNLPLRHLKLRAILETHFKIPVHLENDTNAFLYAQSASPRFKKYKNLVAVMPGTGLGGAAMVNGQLLYGKDGYATEFAHMVLHADSKLSTFEMNTSGAHVSKISKTLGVTKKLTAKDLDSNSADAKKVKKHLVRYLGLGLANLNLIFNPEAFVLGGSIYNYHLKDSKKELQNIIAAHALDGKSPGIIDSVKKYTVAMGVALMSQNN